MIEVNLAIFILAWAIGYAIGDALHESLEYSGRKNPGPTTKPPVHTIPLSPYESTGDPKYKGPK